MKRHKALLVLSAVLVTMLLAGCAALLLGGAAGAGGVVYVKGKLNEDVNASASQVHEATVAALKELNSRIAKAGPAAAAAHAGENDGHLSN